MKGPFASPELRNNWEIILAVIVLVLFTLGHFIVFEPIARRYQTAATRAAALGLSLNPQPRIQISQRVSTLLVSNVMPAAEASRRADSGRLTSELLSELSQTAARHSVRIVTTEPAAAVQQAGSVQSKAHVRALCTYGGFVDLLDDLAHGHTLVAIDRFALTPNDNGGLQLDMWVSRLTIKQNGAGS